MSDTTILKELSKRWVEIANAPVMEERKKAWHALHNLRPVRPVYLFETATLNGFINEKELLCEDGANRSIEKYLRHYLKHFELVDDDMIMRPYYEVEWSIGATGNGVDIAYNINSSTSAIVSNQPIRTPADTDKLVPRQFWVDRENTEKYRDELQAKLSMPVVINGPNWFCPALSKKLVDYIGMENVYYWLVDCPECVEKLLSYFCNDMISYYKFEEKNGLVGFNNGGQFTGSGSYGFANDLPSEMGKRLTLRDAWIWCESQETTTISPDMFQEIFLPYMQKIANMFGLTYYGCCEQLHDRWDAIAQEIQNIRCVSISPWSDISVMAEKLDGKYIFSRKPPASNISGMHADFALVEADLKAVQKAVKSGLYEIIYRDIYDVAGDFSRITEWGKLCAKYFK